MNVLKTTFKYKGVSRIVCLLSFCVLFSLAFVSPASAQSAFDDPGVASAASGGGDLKAVEPKIDAGAVALGSSSQIVVLIKNEGGRPITPKSISLYPSSNVSASEGQNECQDKALPSGAICAIALSVKGLQPGRFRIEMLMRHDGVAKLLTSTVTGTVERSDDASADIISDIDTIPSELKFQTLKESRPLTRSIIMRNVTSKEINIDAMEIQSNPQAGYSLESECNKLLSGEACIATVTWAPKQRGPATGVLVVSHDGPTGVVSIVLDGEYQPDSARQVDIFPEAVPGKGLLTASQTDIDFGDGIESTSSITASLVNVGDAPLTLGNIKLSNKDSGIQVEENGCVTGKVLNPVEACALTLTWNPVREGAILDDVQILHDGARGILVLPVRGAATKAINKDNKAIVYGQGGTVDPLASIPSVSASEVGATRPARSSSNKGKVANAASSSAALEGFKVTSLARTRAIISGPGGSRVVKDGQETVIGGALWRVNVRDNAVEFKGAKTRIVLLFDSSLSFSNDSSSTVTSSNDEGN